jgi:hypothetical protein
MAAVLPLVLHKHQKMNDRKPLGRDVDPFPNQYLSEHIVGLLGLHLTTRTRRRLLMSSGTQLRPIKCVISPIA